MEESRTVIAKKKRRRWLWLLLVLLIPVVAGVSAWKWLQTAAGEALLKAQVLSAAGDALTGKVDLDRIGLDGDHVVLEKLRLYTPEGQLVASIERLEADLELGALSGNRVHLSNVQIEEAQLLLVEDERGWNLSRAIAAKKAPSDDSTGASTPWRVDLDSFALTKGLFTLTQPGRAVEVHELGITGHTKLALSPLAVEGALDLTGQMTVPLTETLTVKLEANHDSGQHALATISLGETRLRLDADVPAKQATVQQLTLGPRELGAFVEGWPLKVPLQGTGVVGLSHSALELSAGKGRVTVSAKYDLATSSAETVSLDATSLDPQELLGLDFPSELSLEGTASFTDWRPETLSGTTALEAKWVAQGDVLLDATLDAHATNGVLEVKKLRADGPGLRVSARGTSELGQLKLIGTVDAQDLKQLDLALQRHAGLEPLGLGGKGKVQLWAKGPLAHPSLTLIGRLERFEISGVSVNQLTVDADLPDVRKPLDTDILLHAKQLTYGERQFDEVTFDFITHGRELDLDFKTKGLGDLQAHVLATLDARRDSANVTALELKWSDIMWSLEAPTLFTWGDVLELKPFVLHDGERRLTGHVKKTRRQLDAELHAGKLDLARLPNVLALQRFELGGTLVSLDVTATGNPSSPDVSLQGEWANGKAFGVSGIALTADAQWKASRLAGKLVARTDVGAVDGTFDLPLLALRDETPEPMSGQVRFKDIPSSFIEKQVQRTLPLSGQLSGALVLSGTGQHPGVTLEVTSPTLTLKREPGDPLVLSDTKLALATKEDDTLGVTLDTKALEGAHHVGLTIPFTLSRLRTAPPTKDEWLSMPLTLDFTSSGVSLNEAELQTRPGLPRDDELAGTGSMQGTLTGTPRAPTGEVRLTLAKVTAPPLRNADLRFVLRADATQTRLSGTALLDEKPAVEWDMGLEAPLEAALAPVLQGGGADELIAALQDTPLDALISMAPFDLAPLLRREGGGLPGGQATAKLEASGTLEAPRARLLGTVSNLRFDKLPLGAAKFEVTLKGREQTLDLALTGSSGDTFTAKGTTKVDLRLSSLRRGLLWKTAPVELSLDAKRFDLGFLSGATESLRIVGGRLDLEGRVNGSLGTPRFLGDATLMKGRLALAGRGDYRDIECVVHATNDLVELKKLDVKAGAGTVSLVARAERQGPGEFHLTSSGQSERFPLVNDDQLLAALTIAYSLEGDATADSVALDNVTIPRAEVLLPEVKRKDLQDLQRSRDIIILRGGARATQRQRAEVKSTVVTAQDEGFTFAASIDAPRNLWVRSSDVNLELGLSDGFRVENDALGTRLTGEAKVLQGTLAVIGREFTVQKNSTARFAGPATQPYVNVTALHVNAKEDVKITVTVAGKGTDVALKATSEPPLPESDIYAILATGRRTLKTNGGAAITPGQAASVVGQLAASQLKTVLAKKVPIDVFNFETSDNFDKVRLDVGKYLGDSLYLGATVNIGARRDRGENAFAGRLEWQMSRSVSLEAYAGDALSFGADAVWSQDY
jgi:translocation and assembly module TamB